MGKTQRFNNLETNLERLATRVETYLQENKFEIAFSKDPTDPASWFFIQARKAGALRTAAGARRSTDITIKGDPNNFEVTIGTGEWGKNLITSVPLFIVPIIGVTATLAKLYTAKKFEDNLWKFIKDQAQFLSGSGAEKMQPSSRTSGAHGTGSDSRAYRCDYVEGYSAWKSPMEGGTIVLIRERDGKNRIVFKSSSESEQLIIPAKNIISASIITRKKGLHEDDLLIQIICKDEAGRNFKPIFNLSDDIIRGVLAGMNELVAEDKVLRSFEQLHVTTGERSCVGCGAHLQKEAVFCSSCGRKQQ